MGLFQMELANHRRATNCRSRSNLPPRVKSVRLPEGDSSRLSSSGHRFRDGRYLPSGYVLPTRASASLLGANFDPAKLFENGAYHRVVVGAAAL